MYRCITSDCRFFDVTHLGQITSFNPFWDTLGAFEIVHFSKSNHPEAAILHREILSHQRFDAVTHLGQIENFDYFWGIPWASNGGEGGPEGLKIGYCVNNNPQKLQI